MLLAAIFLIGIFVGLVAQRHGFCVFGALVELFELGEVRRLVGVIAAMLVFSLVHIGGYRHGIEDASALFLVGGLIQGAGYYLASGCTLSLLVRVGEGHKFHLVAFAGFLAGAAIHMALV